MNDIDNLKTFLEARALDLVAAGYPTGDKRNLYGAWLKSVDAMQKQLSAIESGEKILTCINREHATAMLKVATEYLKTDPTYEMCINGYKHWMAATSTEEIRFIELTDEDGDDVNFIRLRFSKGEATGRGYGFCEAMKRALETAKEKGLYA